MTLGVIWGEWIGAESERVRTRRSRVSEVVDTGVVR